MAEEKKGNAKEEKKPKSKAAKETKKVVKKTTVVKKEEKKKQEKKEEKKTEEKTEIHEEKATHKKLYRSRKYRVFTGVCGGIGEYFNIDPNIVRFLWVVSCFAGGVGVIGYIIALIMIPEVPPEIESEITVKSKSSKEIGMLIGGILIFLGVFFLLDRWIFFYFPYRFWQFRYFNFEMLFPLFIIIAGILYILYVHKKGHEEEKGTTHRGETEQPWKSFKRSITDKKIAGVCSGLAQHFEIDPTIIRLLFILMTLFSGVWIGVIIYIVLAVIMPQEEAQKGGM